MNDLNLDIDKIKIDVLAELKKDEHEYCFDKSYCDDKTWKQDNNESREQAYKRVINHWENMNKDIFITEIQKCFGDKYDYIIYSFKGDDLK